MKPCGALISASLSVAGQEAIWKKRARSASDRGTSPSADLEGQLSNPPSPLLRLVRRWRQLRPANQHGRFIAADHRSEPRTGVASTELTRTYGLGKGAVLRVLESHGVARRRQGLTPEQVQEAIRLYRQDWPLARIGERFGRHHSVIMRALERTGVPRRDSHGRER